MADPDVCCSALTRRIASRAATRRLRDELVRTSDPGYVFGELGSLYQPSLSVEVMDLIRRDVSTEETVLRSWKRSTSLSRGR